MMASPPNWKNILTPELLSKFLRGDSEVNALLKQAEKDYVYWDKFKHYSMPPGVSPQEAWAYIKFSRISHYEPTPVKSIDGETFTFSLTKTMYQKLSYIDSHAGNILLLDWQPNTNQKNQLLLSGLTEEAIASSQIEGANTSRKVAKEMLLTNRKPRTVSEQMIINNFKVMQKLQELKNLDLNIDMLQEMQQIITQGTLENESDAGKLRTDEDNISVINRITGEVAFTPPDSKTMQKELERLINYANRHGDADNFIHPVIKASILHFWLAYLHPFVDGNGRTARTLFYWYMLRNNYWLFQYLAISRVIIKSKIAYDNAFLYSEKDNSDLTYFLIYKLKAIDNALDNFVAYYKKKVEQEEKIRRLSSNVLDLKERQIALLVYAKDHPNSELSISQHQIKHQIAYESARRDLMSLVSKGYLTAVTKGKKFVYIPNMVQIKKILDDTRI